MAKHNEWKEIIFSVLILGEQFSLICLSNIILVVLFVYSIDFSISLPLNPAIYRIGNAPKILFSKSEEQNESLPFPHFIFYGKISKITLD